MRQHLLHVVIIAPLQRAPLLARRLELVFLPYIMTSGHKDLGRISVPAVQEVVGCGLVGWQGTLVGNEANDLGQPLSASVVLFQEIDNACVCLADSQHEYVLRFTQPTQRSAFMSSAHKAISGSYSM